MLGPCHYNFNTGVCAIGKTTVATKTKKTTTASWLASHSRMMTVAMKCQSNDKERHILANTTQTRFPLNNLVATYKFTAQSWSGPPWKGHLSGFWLLVQLWDLATTTSTVASVRLGRLYGGCTNKQNYLCMAAGAELEKYAIAHEISNQGNATQHKPDSFGQAGCYLQLCSFTVLHQDLSLFRTILDHGRW